MGKNYHVKVTSSDAMWMGDAVEQFSNSNIHDTAATAIVQQGQDQNACLKRLEPFISKFLSSSGSVH
jgi:hypothetical protein